MGLQADGLMARWIDEGTDRQTDTQSDVLAGEYTDDELVR
jgi:hypothetical protein